jgi:hypothetical protein
MAAVEMVQAVQEETYIPELYISEKNIAERRARDRAKCSSDGKYGT